MKDWNLIDKSNGESILSGNFINGNKLNFVEVRDGEKLVGIKVNSSYAELKENQTVDIKFRNVDPDAKGFLAQFKGIPVIIDDNIKEYEIVYSNN